MRTGGVAVTWHALTVAEDETHKWHIVMHNTQLNRVGPHRSAMHVGITEHSKALYFNDHSD